MKDKNWTILESEYELKTKWLNVRKDHVRMATGLEIPDMYVLEYPDWVNVIAITEDGRFVMERQYRHGLQLTSYEICAGTLEGGEDPLEAAKRELYEETGYGDGEWELYMTAAPNPAAMTNVNYTFLARDVRRLSGQHLELTEDIDVCLMAADEVLALMQNGEILQGIMLAPLWKWMMENQQLIASLQAGIL